MAALRGLWARRRRRPRFVAGSLLVLGFLLSYPALHWWLHSVGVAGGLEYYDLGAYRVAVENWQAGEPLYVPADDGGYHGSYLYPPVWVLLFWPLSKTAFETAGHVWNAASLGLLWIGLQAAVAAYGLQLAWYERGLLLWAIVGFYPVIISVRLAQVSVYLAGLLAVALAALVYAERHDSARAQYASGVATALGGTMKLTYAPTGTPLLADRRRLVGAVVTGLALLAVSLAVFGVDAHRAYLDVLAWGKDWGIDPRHPRAWGPAYYRPLWILGTIDVLEGRLGLVVRLSLAAGIAALAVLAADRDVDAEVFAMGVAAVPLVAPRAYSQDLAVFLPVVVVLLATELRRPPGDGRPLVPVVGLWLAAVHAYGLYAMVEVLPGRVPGGDLVAEASPLLQPGLWAAVLLLGLAAWRVGAAVRANRQLSQQG